MSEEKYKFVTIIPVNPGHWVSIKHDPKYGDGAPIGEIVERGKDWKEFYFTEAVMDWSWFPPNCYGKLAVELKINNYKYMTEIKEGGKVEFQLAWVKAVRDGGAGKFIPIPGAVIEETIGRKWEIYETDDYFKLPDWRGPVLLYPIGRANKVANSLTVAMFSLAVFQKVDESKE